MAPPSVGRGRAGRGRAGAAADPSRQAAGQRPPPQAAPAAARSTQQPGASQQGAWPRPSGPELRQSGVEAATKKMASARIGAGGDGGNGNGNGGPGAASSASGRELGRGGIRGRRALEGIEMQTRTRPESCLSKKGSSGTPVELYSNYFKLVKKPDWVIYQYRVDFSAEEDRALVKQAWLRVHKDKLGNSYLFDGTMIFSSQVIVRPNETLTLTSIRTEDNSPVKIDVKLVGQVEAGNATYLMIFNLLVRRCMGKLDLHLVGRNLFDAKNKTDIPEFRLSVWPGYLTSIRQHESDLLMCCEITHKVMRTDTAYELLMDCSKARESAKVEFSRAMIGQVVLTPYNNKTYRIDDVLYDVTPRSTFPTKEGDISFEAYYKKRYNIQLKDPNQPLLMSKLKAKDIRGGKRDNVVLVPELCTMTGITDTMRNNFQLMKALAAVTHVAPGPRMEKLQNFNRRLQENPEVQKELSGWEMKLNPEFVKVPGRVIAPETIIFGGGIKISAGPTADWTRTSQDKPMLVSAQMNQWVLVTSQRFERDAQNFVRTMMQVAAKMRFQIPQPEMETLQRDNAADMVQAIERIVSRSEPAMIMFAVSNNNADRYNAIKKKCYLDRALSSQVVVGRNLSGKNLLTVATKVAIQINCKLGGAAWTVGLPNTGAMIVGFDVSHDTQDKSKSFGAMVATSNQQMTSWYSSATAHTNGEELSNAIALDIQKALRRWVQVNGTLPSRVLVYRDGVGDGQIGHVHSHEVVCVKKAMQQLYGEAPVRLGYILVTKRINTRIFLLSRVNPGPGTIVDDVITLPEKYDFYLVSQHAKQGTVQPTCYNVIEDNLGWKPDQLQRLSYMLTHLYYNLSSTVRVPAPVQYAHKLALLVSQNLHGQPNITMCDRLFFI